VKNKKGYPGKAKATFPPTPLS